MSLARAARALPLLLATAAGSAAGPSAEHLGDWKFRALLDGTPIGEHRFTVTADGDGRKVVSTASFDVKFLMVTAYRYRHQATERWRGECLQSLVARTDDDGKVTQVRAEPGGDALTVSAPAGKTTLPGCVMSFAYWNPGLRQQTSLLNPQTGHLESVRISAAGNGRIDVHGQPVDAVKYRISGEAEPIDVWYSPAGEWIGLDAKVAGGRTLGYRLD